MVDHPFGESWAHIDDLLIPVLHIRHVQSLELRLFPRSCNCVVLSRNLHVEGREVLALCQIKIMGLPGDITEPDGHICEVFGEAKYDLSSLLDLLKVNLALSQPTLLRTNRLVGGASGISLVDGIVHATSKRA